MIKYIREVNIMTFKALVDESRKLKIEIIGDILFDFNILTIEKINIITNNIWI